jgi:hypothetical protein
VSSLQVRLILMSIQGKIVGASKIASDITDRQRAKAMLRSNGRYQLILTWTEKGSPAIQKPLHKGFGTRMMDDAQQVNIDRGLVKRPPFADNAIGERNPALGAFADRRKARLALPERRRLQINAVEWFVERRHAARIHSFV